MDKSALLNKLTSIKERLNSEVLNAHKEDEDLGENRFKSLLNLIVKLLDDEELRSYAIVIEDALIFTGPYRFDESREEYFERVKINRLNAFLESLILDIENDEIQFKDNQAPNNKKSKLEKLSRKAFIVHGQDVAAKERTARFLEKLGFQAIILHEQVNSGKTIIEKLEKYTDVGFGIVLYTPDDVGEAKANKDNLRLRARQNVVFEHGLLIGKLGRERAFPLVTDHSIELPNDISGMVYMSDRNWEVDLAKEIKALGYTVDLNVLF